MFSINIFLAFSAILRTELNFSIEKFNFFRNSGNCAVIFRKIRQLFTEPHHSLDRFYHFLKILAKFRQMFTKIWLQNGKIQWKNAGNWIFNIQFGKKFDEFWPDFWNWSGAKVGRSCIAREMLKNAPTLAIVAVNT